MRNEKAEFEYLIRELWMPPLDWTGSYQSVNELIKQWNVRRETWEPFDSMTYEKTVFRKKDPEES